MERHRENDVRASAPEYPDADQVGDHLVIDKTEWVPGPHPESHRRTEGGPEYREQYLRCIRCGVEVLRERDFPEDCDGDR
jgi:hypothetical protein